MSFEVEKVIFYEDRACVVRVEELSLDAGVHSFDLEALSPFIVDKSVMLETDTDDVLCSELKVSRSFIGDQFYNAKTKVQEVDLKHEVTAKEFLQNSLANIKSTRHLLLKKISTDTAKGIAEPKEWRASLTRLNEKEGETFNRLRLLEESINSKQVELSDKQIAYKNLKDLPLWRSSLKISLDCKKKCRVKLTLRYMTGAACWRPCAEAFIKSNNINLKLCARLWQNTGELWENIDYELSTERLSQGGELPPLESDYLRTHRKVQEELTVREEARKTNVEIRQIEDIPGIQDNGHSFHALSQGKVSFPEHDPSILVSYWQFNSELSTRLVAHSQQSEYVNELVTFFNYGEIPILECPVSIYRNNTLLGQSLLQYKSPGEKIELDCGNIPEIRIKRRITQEKKDKLMSFWKATENTVQLYISNMGNRAISFELKERVPVSETDKVLIKIKTEQQPDKEGIMTWDVHCPANSNYEIKLCYELRIHRDKAFMSIPV